MADDNDLHRRLDDAFASRSAGVHRTPPDLDDLVGRGQQKTRRTLVAGSLGVIVIGAVGISVFANSATTSPEARSDALPPVDEVASTTVVTGRPVWSCVGPLGTSDDGAVAFYESCTPADGSWSPSAPTTTVLSPDTTVMCVADTIPSTVEATTTIAYCGAPANAATTTTSIFDPNTTPCTGPGCLPGYTVQSGDYPLKVANLFCVSVDELAAANGWGADATEFPFPGTVIRIPPGACRVPPPPSSTIPG